MKSCGFLVANRFFQRAVMVGPFHPLIAAAVLGMMFLGGCGCREHVGVEPAGGFSTRKANYDPTVPPDAKQYVFPLIDPRQIPDPLPTFDLSVPMAKSESIALIGTAIPYNSRATGNIIRFEVRRRMTGERFDSEAYFQATGHKRADGQVHYIVAGHAPSLPGKYEYILRAVGPSMSLEKLDPFLTGTFIVQ